jgi:hypothetical protein
MWRQQLLFACIQARFPAPKRNVEALTQSAVKNMAGFFQVMAAELASPGRRRSGPLGGAEGYEVGGRGGPYFQAGAAELASPGRRRSGPLGGGRGLRSRRSWRSVFSSRGRGTGFARPQAQRPPRGAGSYAKRATVGARYIIRGFSKHSFAQAHTKQIPSK